MTRPAPFDFDSAKRFEHLRVDRLILMRDFADMQGGGSVDDTVRFLEDAAKKLGLGKRSGLNALGAQAVRNFGTLSSLRMAFWLLTVVEVSHGR